MAILRMMVKLGMSFRCGLTILYSFRGKLDFGLYWWLYISETSKKMLISLWHVGIRIITRVHPSSPVNQLLTGLTIPDISEFIKFLLIKRVYMKTKIKFQMTNLSNLRRPSVPIRQTTKYNLRERTVNMHSSRKDWLLSYALDMASWLANKIKASKSAVRPETLLFRKMFGNRVHNDTIITRLCELAEKSNSWLEQKRCQILV